MAICPLHPEVNQGLSKMCRKCGAVIVKTQNDQLIGVKGIVCVADKCLVLKKHTGPNSLHWDFPGGRIQKDEIPKEALRREIKEELPSIGNFSIKEIIETSRFKVIDQQYEVTFYKIEAEPFEVTLTEEHSDFFWVTQDSLESLQNTAGVLIEPGFFRAVSKALSA